MNVKEASKRAGTSVRTMRYYEEIGLIQPIREENGYREYGEVQIERVRLIRAYRELQFSLEEIGNLLDAPRMERDSMLEEKIRAMEMKRRKIDNRIALANSIRMIGPERLADIDFSQIDDQMEQSRRYLEENVEMKAIGERLRNISLEKGDVIAAEVIGHFARIANAPENEINQAIQDLKECIGKYLYPCTDEMLTTYARFYGGDGILAQAIDEAAGEGAAKRMREKVESWIKNHNPL